MSDPYYDPNDTPDNKTLPVAPNPIPPRPADPPPGDAPATPPPPIDPPWTAPPVWPESSPAGGPHGSYETDGYQAPLRIPGPPQGVDASADGRVRIGLWGAPKSGKTTYLAALPIAAIQHHRYHQANWVISGMNQESGVFLTDGVNKLAVERVFPDATVGMQSLSWSFQGEEEPSGALRRRRQVGFVLDVQDVAGEVYRWDENNALCQRVLDQLAHSQGLIYLFDPVSDDPRAPRGQSSLDNFNFFFAMLTALNARVRDAGGLRRNKLPHHIAVCVTKFDHPEVFRPAVEYGWVTQDFEGHRLPRVPTEKAADFFHWMCDVYRGSTARLVRDALTAFFHHDRISYYVSSAIGFRLNPQQIFDYRNYLNVEMIEGVPRICTSPVPMNVLEPLTDLERRIRYERRGRRSW